MTQESKYLIIKNVPMGLALLEELKTHIQKLLDDEASPVIVEAKYLDDPDIYT